MMEPQIVEALRTVAKVCELGLVGMQPQPEWGQGGLSQRSGLFSPLSSRAHHDEVVGVTNQHPQSLSFAFPSLVEDVECDVGEQR